MIATRWRDFNARRSSHQLLHHPNIARITDAQFEDGTFYIAMEHIRGHTIGELMRRLPTNGMLPSIGAVVFIGARALEGLAYAHELADPDGRALGLVHLPVPQLPDSGQRRYNQLGGNCAGIRFNRALQLPPP